MTTWVLRNGSTAKDDLITWWHDQNTQEKKELKDDRTVVRSPIFEVSVWSTRSDSQPKQKLVTAFGHISLSVVMLF